jgi:RNA polymerase primary sigma factor
MDAVRIMAEGIRPLASREEVMRAFAAGDYEALGRHYYALALKEGFSRFHLLGDEALDLAQEVALKVHASLKAWRTGERKLPSKSKNLTFWVMVEADRAVREWFYRNRGVGYANSRLAAKVNQAAKELQEELGRKATPEEIALKLQVPVEVVEEALAIAEAESILSLDDTTEEGTRLEEFVGVDPWEREMERARAFEALEEAIERYGLQKTLGGKEAELLERFLEGDELGEEEISALEDALKQAVVKAAG